MKLNSRLFFISPQHSFDNQTKSNIIWRGYILINSVYSISETYSSLDISIIA